MPIVKVLAALAVADIEAARAWYEQLLGRPADDVPMAEAAEWHVTETGSIQLVQSAERAGTGLVTLSVDDVDELAAALAGRDLELAAAGNPVRDVPDRVDHGPRRQRHHLRRGSAEGVTSVGRISRRQPTLTSVTV